MKQALSSILLIFFVLASRYDSLVFFTEKVFDQKFYVLAQIDSEEETGKEERTSEKEFTDTFFSAVVFFSCTHDLQSGHSLLDFSISTSSYSGEIFSPPESSVC